MKAVLLVFLLALLPIQVSASVESTNIVSALERAAEIERLNNIGEIGSAILTIVEQDPLKRGVAVSSAKLYDLAVAVSKAARVTEVDWKLLLAISYVESNLCSDKALKGDKKDIQSSSRRLYDYWSIGCMQVNLRWWGNAVHEAGLQQQDLLDYEKGIIIGALILKHKVDKYGWKEGIRRYNGKGKLSYIYQKKVLKVLSVIS